MKLFSFPKRKKSKKVTRINSAGAGYQGVSRFGQTKESQILLSRIEGRNRRVSGTGAVFRKKHGIIKKFILLLSVLGLTIFLIIKLDVISYFKVSFVNVEGAGSFVNRDDVKALVEKTEIGRIIFHVDEEAIKETLVKNFLGAKKVVVSKDYQNSIRIFIEERLPLAIVRNGTDDVFLIDSDGYVLGTVNEKFSDLPEVNYEDPIVIGTFLDKEMIPISVDLLRFARQEDVEISSMSFYPNYVRVFVGGGTEVLIGYDKDSEMSLKTVGALLKRSVSENKILKKIDLRYDKVIVLYE